MSEKEIHLRIDNLTERINDFKIELLPRVAVMETQQEIISDKLDAITAVVVKKKSNPWYTTKVAKAVGTTIAFIIIALVSLIAAS